MRVEKGFVSKKMMKDKRHEKLATNAFSEGFVMCLRFGKKPRNPCIWGFLLMTAKMGVTSSVAFRKCLPSHIQG